jgi:hypothetical protein
MSKLFYTGGGYGGSLPGLPARDLTEAEAEAYCTLHDITLELLLSMGLYRREEKLAPPQIEPEWRGKDLEA